MKLLRYGEPGAEKPAFLDADGRIRDLSAHIPDLAGSVLSPDSLRRLAALDPATLPIVKGGLLIGSLAASGATSQQDEDTVRVALAAFAP